MAGLEQHVRAAVWRHGHDVVELEWRLGHKHDGFRPGVGATAWERLRAALDASPAFTQSTHDTVELMGDAAGIKRILAKGGERCIRKTRVADVDVDASGPWTIRGSVSVEEPVPAPAKGAEKFERRKHRLSFRHRCWSVDLTRVRTNLPSHRDDDEDTYEVEIELVDQGALFERTVDHLVECGWQMARELCALMVT